MKLVAFRSLEVRVRKSVLVRVQPSAPIRSLGVRPGTPSLIMNVTKDNVGIVSKSIVSGGSLGVRHLTSNQADENRTQVQILSTAHCVFHPILLWFREAHQIFVVQFNCGLGKWYPVSLIS